MNNRLSMNSFTIPLLVGTILIALNIGSLSEGAASESTLIQDSGESATQELERRFPTTPFISSLLVDSMKNFKLDLFPRPIDFGGGLLDGPCTVGKFNGLAPKPLDVIYENEHISLPLQVQYQFLSDPSDTGRVTLQQTAFIDLSNFRNSFLRILNTKAEESIEPYRSCNLRLEVNSLGLTANPPDAHGHLKIDVGIWQCMKAGGAKTENRLGGGKYEVGIKLQTGIKNGKPVLNSSTSEKTTLDQHIADIPKLAKFLLASFQPASTVLTRSLEDKLDFPSMGLPKIDLSAFNDAFEDQPEWTAYSPKLTSTSIVNDEPVIPQPFTFFPRLQLTDRITMKIVRSQLVRQRTACFLRKQLEDRKNPVPVCGLFTFSCIPSSK